MPTLNGNSIRVWVDGTLLDSTSTQLSFSNNLVEATTQNTGSFSEHITGRKTSTLQVDGYFTATLLKTLRVGDEVSLRIGTEETSYYAEKAYLVSTGLDTGSDSAISLSLTFRINGELGRFIPIFALDKLVTNLGDQVITNTGDRICLRIPSN